MPSASAKVEKIASYEAADPVKQIVNLLEKRIRNLEKRKMKLDNYRLDVKNGKELNDDQKIAVSKYDQVESLLEFSRELSKSMNTVVLESARQQKKLAKKELLERQQHEIKRLQDAFIYCHILSCFQNEDVRSDFLSGENGAVQVTSEQLSQLDQLYKLIGPGLPSDHSDLSNHFHTLAENHIFLVEGKNKEVVGTTYKALKDLLQSIKDCGYFSRSSDSVEEDTISSDDSPEDDHIEKPELNQEIENAPDSVVEIEFSEQQEPEKEDPVTSPSQVTEVVEAKPAQNGPGPLQEVLSPHATFNFLQESQIDLDAPHMDPAVVAVHQMAPPPAVKYAGTTYSAPQLPEEKILTNGTETHEVTPPLPPICPVPVLPAAIPRSVLSPVQQEFDPSHPIPTQTFTNQSFAVMQNMIIPPAYVPVTVHHGPMPPHITPIAVVPGLSPPVTSGASVVPIPVPVPPVSVPSTTNDEAQDDTEQQKSVEVEEQSIVTEENTVAEPEVSSNDVNEKNENGYASTYRGGYRRGRGRGNNGYYRGRGNYNGRGGGFQGHYYQDRNNYNGNFRRGNNRGPRGGNGNNRGRGNYRTQQATSGQQPQQ